jgi:hypothetical protein
MWAAVAFLAPPLLIFWRWRREPRWLAYGRYLLAIAVVWEALSRTASSKMSDLVLGIHSDGWIIGVIYAAFLGVFRGIIIRYWIGKDTDES